MDRMTRNASDLAAEIAVLVVEKVAAATATERQTVAVAANVIGAAAIACAVLSRGLGPDDAAAGIADLLEDAEQLAPVHEATANLMRRCWDALGAAPGGEPRH